MRTRAFAAVLLCVLAGAAHAAVRDYFIAAEDMLWDFAPSGMNQVHCMDTPAPCAIPDPWTDSHAFASTRYIEYTDASFRTQVQQPKWLGILGPIIRAEVGDTIHVHFCNHASSGAYGLHPHGVHYTKDNEGAMYTGANSGMPPGDGSGVEPGACYMYEWAADESSGPAEGEVSSRVWWYHSHVMEPTEINKGLLGAIIITREGMARADGSPRDVDQEFVTAFMIFDKADGEERGLMHSINGYIFGNLKGLVMRTGQRVRWHVIGMGNEVDLHTPHWHGKTLTIGRGPATRRTDVVELLPGSMITADMRADNVGEWLYHCHVSDHINAGMFTTYQILPPKTPLQ